MLKINNMSYTLSGRRINYNYSYDKAISKYFNSKDQFYCEYDVDVSKVPESIAILPFLANVAPIAWFAGFSIELEELDEVFYQSLSRLKEEFVKSYPNFDFEFSEIKVKKIVKNSYNTTKSALLFSGGVDAYATFFRHFDKSLDLVTIHGADVEVDDFEQWNRVVELNETEPLLQKYSKYYIKSNLRTFYTHHVDLLLPELGWWGKVQHGLALNSLIAPISVINKYQANYIASSYTDNINIAWGSTPEIDNNIKWGNTIVSHDGYELKRQSKIDLIVKSIKETKKYINLRVCYSLLNTHVNCSKCEKCYRTIMAIILNNDDPNKYGFEVDENIYKTVLNYLEKGFSSQGVQYFWWEIYDKIVIDKDIFVFSNSKDEKKEMLLIKNILKKNIDLGWQKRSRLDKMKFRIQSSFPKLFKIYLKIRQRQL